MYWCFNVVTEREDYPAAVLVRAIELVESDVGVGGARFAGPPHTLIDGPGRTCRALHIDKHLNRWDLTIGERLWLEHRGERVRSSSIVIGPRIGVDYAGLWAHKPYRFRMAGRAKRTP
jgi:DNA-3-methyladenine glycosylase